VRRTAHTRRTKSDIIKQVSSEVAEGLWRL
jgi:hypothetical protein